MGEGILYKKAGLFKKPACRNCGEFKSLSELEINNGLCWNCSIELKRKREAEAKAARRKEFEEGLAELPAAEIRTDGEKHKQRRASDLMDLKYSNITTKTPFSYLGEFIAIDVETTGLVASSAIVSVCAMRFEDFQPAEIFSTLIDPEREIPKEASAVNHIRDDMVAGKPTIWQIMPSLQAFVGESALVGHNLPFDLGFLYKYGFEIPEKGKRYDTLALSKKVFKKSEVYSYSLEDVAECYNIKSPAPHTAAGDCWTTAAVFARLCRDLTTP